MKIFPIIAAAAVALVIPTVASAAPAQHMTTSVKVVERHDDHGMRGRHHGWRNVCTTTWRHHHRVRTCHRARW